MEEWKEYKLGDVCSRLRSGKGIKADSVFNSGKYPVIGGNGVRGYADVPNFEGQAAIIGRQGAYCGNVRFFEGEAYMTEHAIVAVGNELADTRFLACLLSLMHLGNLSAQSAQPGISVQTLSKQPIRLPSISYQKKVSAIIKSLDDKIEVNRRINDNFYLACLEVILIWLLTSLENDNLEQQAQALFKSWFVDFEPFKDSEFEETEFGLIPRGWKVVSLSVIADYINGLAMQKYRPIEGEKGLPVLKIKELGQGSTDDYSELCSPSLIGEKYIIDDGDIIFSWSGTLMVKVWCGGKCGLNQHLFVVEPKDYPHWFAYQWTKHHLDNFIHIAKDKAVTMGHIKRGELDKAKVVVPDGTSMAAIDSMMKPLHSQIISNKIESRRLASMRDTILPRLMSG
ncbi:MAG: restriction endonuclease subunit S [Bacteroidaceae bacterium]|nr:restriction endonuclease subunit S [Bacteroidaceae bacterium]